MEDNKNRPGTKIYLERQKNEEVVCIPAEQGDAESWVVFRPETRAACRGTKNHPARGISLLSRAAHYPSHFFVSKNKFESPIAAFFCNQISSKSNFFNLLSIFFISLNPISLIPIICFKSSVSFLLLDWKVLKYNCCFFCVDT